MAGNAVSLLLAAASTLKSALEADIENRSTVEHLFRRLRTNTYIISAAVAEDLGSSNVMLSAAIRSILHDLVRTLWEVRDAVDRHLLATKPMRLVTAESLKQQLGAVSSRLDEHLGDLARCIGLETLRMVRGQPPPSSAVAAREEQLPADIRAHLDQLRALADSSCMVDRAVLKAVAEVVVGSAEQQLAALRGMADMPYMRRHAESVVAAGGAPALVLQLSSGSEAAQEQAARALCYLQTLSTAGRAAVQGAGAAPALVQLLGAPNISSSPAVQAQAVEVLRNMADSGPQGQAAVEAAGGIPVMVHLLGSSSSSRVQLQAVQALEHLAAGNRPARRAMAAAGALPTLRLLCTTSSSAAVRQYAQQSLRGFQERGFAESAPASPACAPQPPSIVLV